MSETVKIRTASLGPDKGSADSFPGYLAALSSKPQERYRFIRSIGFGGMKSVLLVSDSDTGREVAMAMMPDFRERPQCDLERFIQEARLTASLEHPNIVPVHDIGVDDSGSPYFTMKYLRGMSLAALLRKLRRGDDPKLTEKYTLFRMLHVFARICNAIDFAHSCKVAHLDIKPDNVNIGEFGEVQLLDWGVAQSLADDGLPHPSPGTVPGTSARGTPGYMAPEQILRSPKYPINESADIYALGALLYAIMTYQNPLSDLPQKEVLQRTISGEIPYPSEVVSPRAPAIPPGIEAVIRKAMAPAPDARYHSVRELRQEIWDFQSGYATRAENASPLKHAGLFLSRNMLILLFAATFILSCALVWLALKYYRNIL